MYSNLIVGNRPWGGVWMTQGYSFSESEGISSICPGLTTFSLILNLYSGQSRAIWPVLSQIKHLPSLLCCYFLGSLYVGFGVDSLLVVSIIEVVIVVSLAPVPGVVALPPMVGLWLVYPLRVFLSLSSLFLSWAPFSLPSQIVHLSVISWIVPKS